MTENTHILWLRPARWKKVSVRRERIAEKLEARNIDVELVGATTSNFSKYGIKAAKGEYDVILGNVRLGLYGGYIISRLSGTPFIGDVSDPLDDIEHLPKPLYLALGKYERFVLRHSNSNIFLPETIKGMEKYGIKGKIAGNAVDFEMFSEPDTTVIEEAHEILQSNDIDTERPIVIYLGSMPEQQHFEEIIEAAHLMENWQFVIIGEGPMANQVNEASNSIENLFFLGAFDYELMPGFLSQADCGLCLENVERPLKISEYGAAHLPTIGAYGKLEEEFSEDEVFFIEPEAERIADVLEWIHNESADAQERADRLHEHARQYSWEEVASTYYNEIISLTKD